MPKVNVSPLDSRKQLLIAESDVNRILLVREYQALASGMRDAAQPIRKLGALAASAAVLAGVYKAYRVGKTSSETPKRMSFVGSLLRLLLWVGLRGKAG